MITINIARDYTKMPGGRHIKEGPFSGEHFRETILKPKYLESQKTGEGLTVNLDGGFGYATSFLEEAFGGLVRDLADPGILNIHIVSDEEPIWLGKIESYIKDQLIAKGVLGKG